MKQKISQDTRLLAKKNTPIYVSAPVNGKIPIYSDVAIFESSQCKPPCKQLGELEANTPLTVTGEVRTFEATDGKGGLPALLSYIEVQFESAGELKKGWILSDSVSKTNSAKLREDYLKKYTEQFPLEKSSTSFFSRACETIRAHMASPAPFVPGVENIHSVTLATIIDSHQFPQSVTTAASKLESIVGQCVIDPPNHIAVENLKGPISYDTFVLPTFQSCRRIYLGKRYDSLAR